MSEKTLRELIAYASNFCDKTFAKTGEIAQMWHAVNADGESKITPQPLGMSRDLSMALVRSWLELEQAVQYVYMGEGGYEGADQRDRPRAGQGAGLAISSRSHRDRADTGRGPGMRVADVLSRDHPARRQEALSRAAGQHPGRSWSRRQKPA